MMEKLLKIERVQEAYQKALEEDRQAAVKKAEDSTMGGLTTAPSLRLDMSGLKHIDQRYEAARSRHQAQMETVTQANNPYAQRPEVKSKQENAKKDLAKYMTLANEHRMLLDVDKFSSSSSDEGEEEVKEGVDGVHWNKQTKK